MEAAEAYREAFILGMLFSALVIFGGQGLLVGMVWHFGGRLARAAWVAAIREVKRSISD